ncbi:hypothetical protein DFH29DRAFT_901191 [Suillus ampliporus]|nr:hypothetical protein DFH29DRAFT_901191 [Suillus ampliporus]
MNNSESPLIQTTGHNYGSTQPTSTGQVDDETLGIKRTSFIARNTGLLFIISAQFFIACTSISVKILNSLEAPVHAFQIIAIKMGFTFIFCVIYMIIMKIPDPITGPKGVRTLLVIRAIGGYALMFTRDHNFISLLRFFGLCGLYLSIQYMSVADATALGFLKPIIAGVAGCILLKERYSVKQAVAGVCSLLGVLLIARPPFLFSSLLAAVPEGHYLPGSTPAQRLGIYDQYISIRAIGKRAHPLHIMAFFSLGCTILGPLGRSWAWSLLLLTNGVFGCTAQLLLTMGVQRETLSRGLTGVYIKVLFAVVLECLIFGVIPSLLSVIGALSKPEPTQDSRRPIDSTA